MWRRVAVTLAMCGLCSAFPELDILGNYSLQGGDWWGMYTISAGQDKVLLGGSVKDETSPREWRGSLTLLVGSAGSVAMVNTIKLTNYVYAVYPDGDYAYVLCGFPSTSLHRVETGGRLSDPVLLWSNSADFESPGGVTPCGPYLCVQTDTVTFLMPSGTVVATLDAPHTVRGMAVSGDTLFVVMDGGGNEAQTVQAVHLSPPFTMSFFKQCVDTKKHTLTVIYQQPVHYDSQCNFRRDAQQLQ